MKSNDSDQMILAQYVAAFEKLDDLTVLDAPEALRVHTDEVGWIRWKPAPWRTNPTALPAFYEGLDLRLNDGKRLPRLYEELVLSYRWLEAEMGSYLLLGNEPADDLRPLLAEIQLDKYLWQTLRPNGYIQFARGPAGDYDPVCFDLNRRHRDGDCRIVKIDHEEILCNHRIKGVVELAPSFRQLVMDTILRAENRTQDASNPPVR